MRRCACWDALLPIILLVLCLSFSLACDDDDDDNDDATPDDDVTDDDTSDDDTGDDDSGDDDVGDDDAAETDPPEFDGLESATADDRGNVVLAWDAAGDASLPVTYNVYMATESGGQDFGSPLDTTQELEYTVADLSICEEYFFVVRAADANGYEEANTVEHSAVPVNYHCDYSPAERLVWTFSVTWGPYDIETLGWINDVNDDGVADVLVESYDGRAFGSNPDEHVFCLSGATGAAIITAITESRDLEKTLKRIKGIVEDARLARVAKRK